MARIKKTGKGSVNVSEEIKTFIEENRSDVPCQYKGTFDTEPYLNDGVLCGGASKVKMVLKSLLTKEEYETAIS
jgi:hypothetical protein